MNEIVERALGFWGMEGAECALISGRENAVFKVSLSGETRVLRLHRRGWRTDRELWSELQWMIAAAEGGLAVPMPVPSKGGEVLCAVEDMRVSVLTWLSGATAGAALGALTPAGRVALFRSIGRETAKLHRVCDAWERPRGFVRWAWNRDGLLGDAPLWDRFWDNPGLTQADRAAFLRFRDAAGAALETLEDDLDYGLIHADLVPDNVMVDYTGDAERLNLIDFDDGGFGFRLFDLATALLKYLDEGDFAELKAALIAGYSSVRDIDLDALDLFMALRAATYVGWNIARMEEEGGGARNGRFIAMARRLSDSWLETGQA